MEEKDVDNVAKAILLYGLQYYKGDERIKEFISDLISQEKEGGLKNHSGLSAPIPRGRKGKKSRDQEVHFDANEEIEKAGIMMDRDIVYNKNVYKRHIHRHSNKVLLHVRALYYLKYEVLGDVVDQKDQGKHVFTFLPGETTCIDEVLFCQGRQQEHEVLKKEIQGS